MNLNYNPCKIKFSSSSSSSLSLSLSLSQLSVPQLPLCPEGVSERKTDVITQTSVTHSQDRHIKDSSRDGVGGGRSEATSGPLVA